MRRTTRNHARRFGWRLASVLTTVVLASAISAHAAPNEINLQGRILDPFGDPLDGPVDLTVAIYNGFSGSNLLYSEDQLAVPLSNGVFGVTIGTGANPQGSLDAATFTTLNAFLEITVEGEILSPRQAFNTAAYSFQADVAANADQLDGIDASALDQSAHVSDSGNPHSVTAGQIGAATAASVAGQIAVHGSNGAAHHTKTSSFGELSGTVALGQIPSAVTRDSELSSGLSGKANSIHNHSASNITSGTLSTFRYDAYGDLSAAGRLDGNASTDVLTRSVGDGRYGIRYSRIIADCNGSLPTVTSAFQKVRDLGSFFKFYSGADVEVTFHGRTYVNAILNGLGVEFQLRVDNAAPGNGGSALMRNSEAGGVAGISNSMSAVYPSLSVGTHTISLWARVRGGSLATQAQCDPGIFQLDHLVVREAF